MIASALQNEQDAQQSPPGERFVLVSIAELELLRGDSQAIHLLCVLRNYADWETGRCYPSRAAIAKDMGVSTDTVDRVRRRLEKAGLLTTEQRKSDSKDYTSNEYTVTSHRVSAAVRIGSRTDAEGVSAAVRIGSRTDAEQTRTTEQEPLNETQGTNNHAARGGDTPASPASKKRQAAFTEADMATAQWIWDRIKAMQPDRKPPNFTHWVNSVRLMRVQDGRTDEQIRQLFGRVQADDFWRVNILSPEKLRAKWDDLQLRLKQAGQGRTNGHDHRSTRGHATGAGHRYDPQVELRF